MTMQISESKYIESIDYGLKTKKITVFILVFLSLFFSFLWNFPFLKQVETLLKTQMAQSACAMSFSHLKVGFFLPKIILTDLKIPGTCLGSHENLNLPVINLFIRGPSFSPLGLAFKLETIIKSQPLGVSFVVGPNRQLIRIEENKFNLAQLHAISSSFPEVAGLAKINAKIILQGALPEEIRIALESKNLSLPSQMLGDLRLPIMDIKDFSLKLDSEDGKKLVIKEFIMGNVNSPLRAKITGQLNLVAHNFLQSQATIRGEAAFSEEFLDAFPLINLMLPQFQMKDGFYQLNLSGPLTNLRPTP
jgi:hypothetical protein